MKKPLLLFSILCLFSIIQPLQAQHYGTTLGLRLGNNDYYRSFGITGEQRLLKHVTVEGILQSDFNRNTTGHLLLKRHYPILSKRLNYHIGAGVSAGNEESFIEDPETNTVTHTYGNHTLGADLMLGVELTIFKLAVSLDYKPNFNISGREEFYQGQVGISVRSVLVKSKDLNKKKRQKARSKKRKDQTSFWEKFNLHREAPKN